MGMVQVSSHQVIDVIAMRYRFMATMGTMHVAGRMPLAFVTDSAILRVGRADRDCMFVVVVIVVIMKMPVMQIIDMISVLYRGVAAARSVDVNVVAIGVHLVRHDVQFLPFFHT